MPQRNIEVSNGTSYNGINEAYVPSLLRITLRALRCVGAAPARLRRTRGGWLLAVSPVLAKLQRLSVAVPVILGLSCILIYLTMEGRLRFGRTGISNILHAIELSVLTIPYCVGILNTKRMERVVFMLQRIYKIKTSLKWSTTQARRDKTNKTIHVLFFYIVWKLFTHIADFIAFPHMNYSPVDDILQYCFLTGLYLALLYQGMAIRFLQLHWSMTVLEINSTLTLVNNQLEFLLKRSAVALQFGFGSFRHVNLGYDAVSDMVRDMDKDYATFLLFNCLSVLLHLLKTSYNLVVVLGTGNIAAVVRQANWCMIHLCNLLLIVEPGHRLQEQKTRTERLLNELASRVKHSRLDLAPLKPFFLQLRLSKLTLGPCDVFTIDRPFVARVIGGITTYLIIIFQFQNISETI